MTETTKQINGTSIYKIASELIDMGFNTSDKKIIKDFGFSDEEVQDIINEMKKQ